MGNESLLYFLKFPLLGLVYLFVLSALWVIVRSLPEPTAKGKKGERSGESQEEEALNPSTTLSGVQPASLNSTLGFGEGQRQLTQEELTLSSLPTAVGLESVNGPYLEVVASSNLTAKIIPLTQEIVLGRSKDCHGRLRLQRPRYYLSGQWGVRLRGFGQSQRYLLPGGPAPGAGTPPRGRYI